MILAIDWDGVIHDRKNPSKGKRLGPPVEGAKEALGIFRERGNRIIIHSVVPEKVIRDWMEYFELPYDEITRTKPQADIYIDDKGLRFENWEKTLNIVNNLK